MTRNLSTLEMTVIGLAWLRGPLTIYAIMKDLSMSASSYHKLRAGSAYSVANRLLTQGYLQREGGHGEGMVSITEMGRQALEQWIMPIPTKEVEQTIDLVRLRVFFLSALPEEHRLEFIDRATEQVQAFLNICRETPAQCEETDEYFGALAAASLIIEAEARLKWLRLAREYVEYEPKPGYADRILKSIDELG